MCRTLVQASFIGAPFVIAGAIKAGYDVGFWKMFRSVPTGGDGERAS